MTEPHTPADFLGKQLIPAMPYDKFIGVFSEAFDPPETVIPGPPIDLGDRTAYPIGSTHYVLDTPLGWSFFESATETAWRAHVAAWADFARGYWRTSVPTVPGTYPVKDASHNRRKDHTFVQRGDRVFDVDSGFLNGHERTRWVGWFWSHPYPPLPGAV